MKAHILDDLAALAGGTASLVAAAGQQLRRELRSRTDSLAARLDLVPREDFERLEALLVKSRQEQDSLRQRLEALERGKKGAPPKPKSSRACKGAP